MLILPVGWGEARLFAPQPSRSFVGGGLGYRFTRPKLSASSKVKIAVPFPLASSGNPVHSKSIPRAQRLPRFCSPPPALCFPLPTLHKFQDLPHITIL